MFIDDGEFVGVKIRRENNLQTLIATAQSKLAVSVPETPSPERGMALLLRGKAKNDLRTLKAHKPKA